jgi:hypothetical protein
MRVLGGEPVLTETTTARTSSQIISAVGSSPAMSPSTIPPPWM